MPTPEQTQWVILAGGQASRMGGNDKGLIKLADKPLIQHVIDTLRPQTSHITINANRNYERYAEFGEVFGELTEEVCALGARTVLYLLYIWK